MPIDLYYSYPYHTKFSLKYLINWAHKYRPILKKISKKTVFAYSSGFYWPKLFCNMPIDLYYSYTYYTKFSLKYLINWVHKYRPTLKKISKKRPFLHIALVFTARNYFAICQSICITHIRIILNFH